MSKHTTCRRCHERSNCECNCRTKKYELKETDNVGFSQKNLPTDITPCQFRQLPNFENATIHHGAAVEPSIAVNPKNPCNIVVVWQQDRISDSGALEAGIAYTFDGGQTWNLTTIPFDFCEGGFVDRVSDVWLSFSACGDVLYFSALPFNVTQNKNTLDQQGVVIHRSFDGGKTWTCRQWQGSTEDAFNRCGSGFSIPFDDKPSVTADPNHCENAYVVWERFDSVFGPTFFHAPTLFTKTVNCGDTWSNFKIIYEPQTDPTVSRLIPLSTFNNVIVVIPKNSRNCATGERNSFNGDLLNFMVRTITNAIVDDEPDLTFFDIAFIRSRDLGETWDSTATSVTPVTQLTPNTNALVFTGGYTYDAFGNVIGGTGTLMRTGDNVTSY